MRQEDAADIDSGMSSSQNAVADLDFSQKYDDVEPTLYETVVVSDNELNDEEPIEADKDTPSMASALEAFVTVSKEPTVDARVNRIAREIAELRAELGHQKTSKLADEFSQLCQHSTLKITTSESQTISDVPEKTAAVERSPEFAEMERRVAQLESRLGVAAGQPQASEVPSIMTTVLSLQQKLALLTASPEHIDTAIERLNKMQQAQAQTQTKTATSAHQLQERTKQRELQQSQVSDAQIQSKLYTRLQHLDPLINELPHVILRLQTLRGVHAQIVSQTRDQSQIEHTLAAMKRDISEWTEVLNRVEAKLDTLLSR